jgi:hypothetical protein
MAISNKANVPVITSKQLEKARDKFIRLRGRPSIYNADIASEIAVRMAEGETLTHICQDVNMPCLSTVYDWEGQLPEFAEVIACARQSSGHALVDKAMDITDDLKGSTTLTEVRVGEVRAKIRLEVAKARNRSYYGDNIQVNQHVVTESMSDRIKRLTGAPVIIPAEFAHVIDESDS